MPCNLTLLQRSLKERLDTAIGLEFEGTQLSPLNPDIGVFGEGKGGHNTVDLQTGHQQHTVDMIAAFQVVIPTGDPDAGREMANELVQLMKVTLVCWSKDQPAQQLKEITEILSYTESKPNPRVSHQRDSARIVQIFLRFELSYFESYF